MKLLFYHSKKRMNGKGEAPIYCRVTTSGERCEISTGITVRSDMFKNGYVSSGHEFADLHNAKINYFKAHLQAIHLDMLVNGKYASARAIKERFLAKPVIQKKFVQLLDEIVCEVSASDASKSTKTGYRVKSGNICRFLKKSNLEQIKCADVDVNLVSRFREWCFQQKYAPRYINKHLWLIGQVLKAGVKAGYIDKNLIAFVKKEKVELKPIVALTKSELSMLEGHKFVSKKLQQVADLYVFQCYTGFAYVDLCRFSPGKHIHLLGDKLYIIENRQKTDVGALIPLFKKSQELLSKYNNSLPLLSLQRYNDYIKEVADIVGIEKHLTTHTARKTFGMIKLNEGFSIESVARMMGHSTTKTTQRVYAKVTHERIDKERADLGVN